MGSFSSVGQARPASASSTQRPGQLRLRKRSSTPVEGGLDPRQDRTRSVAGRCLAPHPASATATSVARRSCCDAKARRARFGPERDRVRVAAGRAGGHRILRGAVAQPGRDNAAQHIGKRPPFRSTVSRITCCASVIGKLRASQAFGGPIRRGVVGQGVVGDRASDKGVTASVAGHRPRGSAIGSTASAVVSWPPAASMRRPYRRGREGRVVGRIGSSRSHPHRSGNHGISLTRSPVSWRSGTDSSSGHTRRGLSGLRRHCARPVVSSTAIVGPVRLRSCGVRAWFGRLSALPPACFSSTSPRRVPLRIALSGPFDQTNHTLHLVPSCLKRRSLQPSPTKVQHGPVRLACASGSAYARRERLATVAHRRDKKRRPRTAGKKSGGARRKDRSDDRPAADRASRLSNGSLRLT